MKEKLTAILVAGVLCAAPLAGSGAAAPDQTAQEAAALNQSFMEDNAVEEDTAGSSLKIARAAAGMVEVLATNYTAEDVDFVVADATAWLASLTPAERATMLANWPAILQVSRAIVADPASQAALLSDAGVTTDFTDLDMSDTNILLDALDTVFSTTDKN